MIALIGCGKMGYALLYAMLQSKKFSQGDVVVAEKDRKLAEQCNSNLGVKVFTSSQEAVQRAHTVVIAVKPLDVQKLLEEIKPFTENKLIISIAAGLKTTYFEKALPKARVVRVMPNIGCMVQAMAGAFALGKSAATSDKETAAKIFSPAGIIGEVREEQLDAVTALSGSGPAFFAFFAETLARAAVKNGLDKEAAAELAAQTMLGTAKLLQSGQMDSEKLIKSVASKGGTTEAGLKKLYHRSVEEAIIAAIDAAVKRSRELGKGAPEKSTGGAPGKGRELGKGAPEKS